MLSIQMLSFQIFARACGLQLIKFNLQSWSMQ